MGDASTNGRRIDKVLVARAESDGERYCNQARVSLLLQVNRIERRA
jgi:hypothetical protein